MDQTPMQQGEILLYNNDGEKEFVSVVFRDETFWLTQKAMAELFDVNVPAISKHLQNIYEEEELTRDATVSKMETVQAEGSRRIRRTLEHYNLDAIIAVGYRVQPGCHHRRGLPGELQKGHPVPPVGDQDTERVHHQGLCPQ